MTGHWATLTQLVGMASQQKIADAYAPAHINWAK